MIGFYPFLVAHGEFVSVGFTNSDICSLKLKDEASLDVYDRAVGGEMIRVFEEDLARSEPYAWEAWRTHPLRGHL